MQNKYLKNLLEYYWLRPETAVWRAIDCAVLDGIELEPPVIDLGCGDGAFSFLRAGGCYSLDYDFSTETINLGKFFSNVDIYDHCDSAACSERIMEPAHYKIDIGFDHKPALLAKAALTGLYGRTVEGDANTELPFARASIRTVYSNILYWLEDYPATLREIARVLKPGGRCIIQVPSERFREFSFYQRLFVKTGNPQWEWLKLLDRGRSDSIKNYKSEAEWRMDFETAGLCVERCTPYLPRLVIEAWDIGLRPISPMLIEMASSLYPAKRREIKQKWVANLLPMLGPLCEHSSEENGFYLFQLSR
jgi:SAM-dependent methyltransferase